MARCAIAGVAPPIGVRTPRLEVAAVDAHQTAARTRVGLSRPTRVGTAIPVAPTGCMGFAVVQGAWQLRQDAVEV